jgi:hypothetical protein
MTGRAMDELAGHDEVASPGKCRLQFLHVIAAGQPLCRTVV